MPIQAMGRRDAKLAPDGPAGFAADLTLRRLHAGHIVEVGGTLCGLVCDVVVVSGPTMTQNGEQEDR
jgi:hypothetical protein